MLKKIILLSSILTFSKLQAIQPDLATSKYLKKLDYVATNLGINQEQACLFIFENNIKKKSDLDKLAPRELASRLSQTLTHFSKARLEKTMCTKSSLF